MDLEGVAPLVGQFYPEKVNFGHFWAVTPFPDQKLVMWGCNSPSKLCRSAFDTWIHNIIDHNYISFADFLRQELYLPITQTAIPFAVFVIGLIQHFILCSWIWLAVLCIKYFVFTQSTTPRYSVCTKRRIWDDIIVILKYFWQRTIAWSEDTNTDDTCILTLFTKHLISANIVPKFLWCRNILWPNMIYLNHPHTYLHSVRSLYLTNIAVLLRYGKKIFYLHLHLERRVVECDLEQIEWLHLNWAWTSKDAVGNRVWPFV